jgi:hypothetical protein
MPKEIFQITVLLLSLQLLTKEAMAQTTCDIVIAGGTLASLGAAL